MSSDDSASNEGQNYICRVYNEIDGSDLSINAVRPINIHEYEELRADSRLVDHYHPSQNVVRAVIANRNEVLSSIVDAAGSYLHSEMPAEQIIKTAIFEISRRFANMCSLFRSFLDHFDRYFVHNYGKDSAEYIGWKAAKSAEYDRFLSYKIVYTMRNYIQHYDMPPLRMSISDSERE